MDHLEDIYDIFSELEDYSVIKEYSVEYGIFHSKIIPVGTISGERHIRKPFISNSYHILKSIGKTEHITIPNLFKSTAFKNIEDQETINFYNIKVELKSIKTPSEIKSIIGIFSDIRSMINRCKTLTSLEVYGGFSDLKKMNSVIHPHYQPHGESIFTVVNWNGSEDYVNYRKVADSIILSICLVEEE